MKNLPTSMSGTIDYVDEITYSAKVDRRRPIGRVPP